VGGEPYSAAISQIENGTIRFLHNEQSRSLGLRDLVTWGFPAQPARGTQVVLADGGLLVADVLGSDGERLAVNSALLKKLALPLDQVSGIIFHPPLNLHRRDELLRRIRTHTASEDLALLDNGDQVSGTLVSIDAAELKLQAAVGMVNIQTERIVALAFDASLIQATPAREFRTIVGFDDGSRLAAADLTLADGQAELALAGDRSLQVAADHVVFLQPLASRVQYLSDLKPAGYKHVPFLELPWEYELDYNVLGTPLRSNQQLYLKGIGMHPASRLTFALDGSHKRFAVEAALDDRAGAGGSVVFRVFIDAQQKYASNIVRGGDAPISILLDLPAGAKTLSLIVDFADRGDELDYANWLSARLEK
jgi:hypothetical protein